ncbi:MAG: YbaK/EbsC family protein [Pseudomonadota bacterium]
MCGAELTSLPEPVQRVARALQASGHPHAPVMLGEAARTAQQAADALGVALGQIAKSIVFRRKSDNTAVLVVTSGDRRVDERKLEALVCPDGKHLGRADAEFVKLHTGFSIGGVSPLAHTGELITVMDRSLLRFDTVWAAAGHPNAVFQVSPQELELMMESPVADVAVGPDEAQLARESAIAQVRARAQSVTPDSDPVTSPCISVCRVNAQTGLCEGCFRTLGEISAWGRSGNAAKRDLWRIIEQRMARSSSSLPSTS